MSKRRQERPPPPGNASALAALVARLRPWLLPAAVALLIAPHLIPSEAVDAEGTFAVPAMLWCVLLVAWGITTAFGNDPRIIFSWSDAAFLLLIGWHTISGLLPREGIVTRSAWNVVWLWIGYGIAYFLLRQLLLSSLQTRAVVAVMLGLAICLTAHAYYQYFVTMPRVRQALEEHPEQVLRENQIPLDPDSPVRQHFENRVRALEPLATFALTNSLAGFLAPWIMVALGLVPIFRHARQVPAATVTVLVVGLGLLGCLLLTKSRTAMLAVLAGGVLLVLYGAPRGWQLRWQLPAAIAGAILLLALVAVAVGGLDAQVLSEAPKSVLYRLEYWRATAAMIGDFPLLGCGPGNFQDYYARYKLPQASETIADPHNVFLEVWATAGTPALAAFLLWIAALVFDLARRRGQELLEPLVEDDGGTAFDLIRRLFVGGAAGIALGFALAFLTQFPLWTAASGGHVGILLMGLPLAAVALWFWQVWLHSGPLGKSLPVIALMALLINLCAAGAASFPGVATSALVLTACALEQVNAKPVVWHFSSRWLVLLLVLPLGLAGACLWTEYTPVLRRQALLQDAQSAWELALVGRGRVEESIDLLKQAAAADPASSEPWERLAEIYLEQWRESTTAEAWERFAQAAEQYRRLRPAWYEQHRRRGEWYLQAHSHSPAKEHLLAAVEAYRAAVERSPNHALARAQLAWVLHLAGEGTAAKEEAERALALDALNPHQEFALRNHKLTDPRQDDTGWRLRRPETAEQTMQTVRKS